MAISAPSAPAGGVAYRARGKPVAGVGIGEELEPLDPAHELAFDVDVSARVHCRGERASVLHAAHQNRGAAIDETLG